MILGSRDGDIVVYNRLQFPVTSLLAHPPFLASTTSYFSVISLLRYVIILAWQYLKMKRSTQYP